jgi:hypothetical protein
LDCGSCGYEVRGHGGKCHNCRCRLVEAPFEELAEGDSDAEVGYDLSEWEDLEEIVVLGYLVRRLEQRGHGLVAIVAIAVAVRVSYHLYYGWNAIPILLWALASVLVYLRVRRLLPFIICHIAWDVAIPLQAFYPAPTASCGG